MATDEAIEPRDDGPSFGRMVVDGCCHAFAKALREVRAYRVLPIHSLRYHSCDHPAAVHISLWHAAPPEKFDEHSLGTWHVGMRHQV